MTKWHLMFVGFLALAAAVLVGLNWTAVDQTVGGETETEPPPEPVKAKTQQAPQKSDGARSDLQAKLEERCEKLVAKRAEEDQEAEIEEACACTADEISSEFEEELPDIMKSGKADPETENRMDEILDECIQSSGLALQ